MGSFSIWDFYCKYTTIKMLTFDIINLVHQLRQREKFSFVLSELTLVQEKRNHLTVSLFTLLDEGLDYVLDLPITQCGRCERHILTRRIQPTPFYPHHKLCPAICMCCNASPHLQQNEIKLKNLEVGTFSHSFRTTTFPFSYITASSVSLMSVTHVRTQHDIEFLQPNEIILKSLEVGENFLAYV